MPVPRRSYLAVGAGFLVNLMLGWVYTYGVFLLPLAQDFRCSTAAAAAPFAIFVAMNTLGNFLGGWLQDRLPPRLVISTGNVIFYTGLLAASRAHSLPGFIATYSLWSGVGEGMTYVPCVSTAVKWFPARRGLVTGLVIGGLGLGAVAWAPLCQALIDRWDWRAAFAILAGAFLVASVLASQFIHNPPSKPVETEAHDPGGDDYSLRRALGTGAFWLAFAGYVLATGAGLLVMSHIVAIARGSGFTPLAAALAVSFVAPGNAAGRLIFGALSDRQGRTRVLILTTALQAGICLVLATAHAPGVLYPLCLLFGLCYGSWYSIYAPLVADLYGTRHLGSIYGVLTLSYGVGALFGPVIGGAVRDATGSYAWALWGCSAACLGACALFSLVRKPGKAS